jgi:hypothetical protein
VSLGEFDVLDLQADCARPVFVNHLVQNLLPALPDLQDTLNSGASVRIAEVGCGEGIAAITIALA